MMTQLATSPLWQNLLLEDPWPLGLSLFIVAGVLWYLSTQQTGGKLRKFALVAAVAAVLVFVLAKVVSTTRENIIAKTQQLIGYTAPLDLTGFKSLVAPNVTITVGEDNSTPIFTGSEVFDKLERAVRNYPIQNQSIVDIDANIRNADYAISQFDVRSDAQGGRVMTRWRLTWHKDADDQWHVVSVQWLDCPGLIGLKADPMWLR